MKNENSSASKTPWRLLRGGIRMLTIAALMAALSIICGKYLAIPVGTVLRFSFENLPLLFSGMILGPVAGLLTGAVADIVGCLMVGYTINPIVTLGAASIGLLGGILYRVCRSLPPLWRTVITVLGAHLVGSVLIKTWGLSAFYDMPFYLLLLWRTLNYLIVGALECVALYYITRHKAIQRQLERMQL